MRHAAQFCRLCGAPGARYYPFVDAVHVAEAWLCEACAENLGRAPGDGRKPVARSIRWPRIQAPPR